jgi:hypothetical protein
MFGKKEEYRVNPQGYIQGVEAAGKTKCMYVDPVDQTLKPYGEIWGIADPKFQMLAIPLGTMNAETKDDTILAVGRKQLKLSTSFSTNAATGLKNFGVTVCNTIANAGLVALAEALSVDVRTHGLKITKVKEQYQCNARKSKLAQARPAKVCWRPGMPENDRAPDIIDDPSVGHVFLIVGVDNLPSEKIGNAFLQTEAATAKGVLVDFWYYSMDGEAAGAIGSLADLDFTRSGRWNFVQVTVQVNGIGANKQRYELTLPVAPAVVPAAAAEPQDA